ncbi:MAG: hypothetical protein GX456_16505 [Verrucomicrobia bacterium]|nr:hypothetical protein [Verrucomicrobiota bacterium]
MHIKFSPSLSLRERRLDAAVVSIGVLMFCLLLPASARAVAVPPSDDETKADTFELMSVRTGAELERGPHHQVLETIAEYRDKTGQTMLVLWLQWGALRSGGGGGELPTRHSIHWSRAARLARFAFDRFCWRALKRDQLQGSDRRCSRCSARKLCEL